MNKTFNFEIMGLKKRSIKYTESLLLCFIWVVVFLSPFFVNDSSDSINWHHIINVWLRFAPYLIITILNHFVLIPYLFYQKKLWYFISALVLIAALSLTLPQVLHLAPKQWNEINQHTPNDPFLPPAFKPNHLPPFGERMHPQPRPFEMPPWINSLLIGFLVIGFDIGLRSTFKWGKTEQEKAQLEREKVKNELAFLKNQLSPHFFMNTLNNIHSLIDIDTEEAKESIIRLSKLMRHLLYESEEERINLSKEVNFIQSYVELMKLRFTEKVKVSFKVNVETTSIYIPPLLFTSLIENAFKYGVSYQNDSFVNINLSTEKKQLIFHIQNSKIADKNGDDFKNGGIGLENTRKRLNLLYPLNYEMKIDETPEIFSVQLKIPL